MHRTACAAIGPTPTGTKLAQPFARGSTCRMSRRSNEQEKTPWRAKRPPRRLASSFGERGSHQGRQTWRAFHKAGHSHWLFESPLRRDYAATTEKRGNHRPRPGGERHANLRRANNRRNDHRRPAGRRLRKASPATLSRQAKASARSQVLTFMNHSRCRGIVHRSPLNDTLTK
jgi:hypothetical protein